jgi:hypothetical protein
MLDVCWRLVEAGEKPSIKIVGMCIFDFQPKSIKAQPAVDRNKALPTRFNRTSFRKHMNGAESLEAISLV